MWECWDKWYDTLNGYDLAIQSAINEAYDDVPQPFDITVWHNFILCDHPEYDYINYESKLIRINGRISKIGGKDNFYHLAKDSMGNNIAVLLILLLDNLKHRKIKSQKVMDHLICFGIIQLKKHGVFYPQWKHIFSDRNFRPETLKCDDLFVTRIETLLANSIDKKAKCLSSQLK